MPEVLGSFAPSTFVTGGLRDDFDAKIIEARAEFFDYQGKSQEVTAIKIVFEELDSKDQIEQMYSFAQTCDFVPNEADGGDTVVKVGTHEVPFNSSNFAFFLSKLVSLGFPEERMSGKLSFLVGLSGHWQRQAAPVRAGLAAPPDSKKGASTILCLTKKLKWPWETNTSTATSGTRAAAAGARAGVRTRTATTTTKPSANAPTPASAPNTATVDDAATPSQLDADDIVAIIGALNTVVPNAGDTETLTKAKVSVFQNFNKNGLDATACNMAIKAITPDFLMENGFMLDGEGKNQTITRL